MKKFTKVLSLICVLSLIGVFLFSTVALATSFNDVANSITNGNANTGNLNEKMLKLGGVSYTLVQTCGNILAILILLIYGVKWMFATPQKKAELKDRLWNYVIGAGLVFGGVHIIPILSSFWEGILK